MSEQQWVGIDVCHDECVPLSLCSLAVRLTPTRERTRQKYLDIYVRPQGKLFQVTNDEIGIRKLVQTLKNIQPELIVLEATGGMEIDAAIKLTQAELAIAVINPRQARDFAKATGAIAKTDAVVFAPATPLVTSLYCDAWHLMP